MPRFSSSFGSSKGLKNLEARARTYFCKVSYRYTQLYVMRLLNETLNSSFCVGIPAIDIIMWSKGFTEEETTKGKERLVLLQTLPVNFQVSA